MNKNSFPVKEWERLFQEAGQILRTLPPEIRPYSTKGKAGALIELSSDMPAIIVPDLHAREDLLPRLFSSCPPFKGKDKTVAELLKAGEIALIMLGDGFHSEGAKAKQRWLRAFREYRTGWRRDRAMREEMEKALSAMAHVATAIIDYPGRFIFLKGNHDNVLNRDGDGNYEFFKYASEGAMTKSWIEKKLGSSFLYNYAHFEEAFPLMARGTGFLACHAEPAYPIKPEDLIENGDDASLIEALTWTRVGAAEENAVKETLAAFFPEKLLPYRIIGGHRPSKKPYYTRAKGLFIQIHTIDRKQAAFLEPGELFVPERDIFPL